MRSGKIPEIVKMKCATSAQEMAQFNVILLLVVNVTLLFEINHEISQHLRQQHESPEY